MRTSYSMWRSWKNCRKKCQLRYLEGYVPIDKPESLNFGALIHACLEHWYGAESFDLNGSAVYICAAESLFEKQFQDAIVRALGMMDAYMQKYPTEKWEVVAVEREFEADIINPETGAKSRSFTMGGKVDLIVKSHDGYWLMEHKTASKIDAGYIERLWTDFQIILYSHYIEQTMGIKLQGVIYNILQKCPLKMKQGETEDEFQGRYKKLCAKNKTGTSTAQRQMSESEADYFNRIQEWYKQNDAFHREEILINRGKIKELQHELWELTKSFLEAQRRGMYYRNDSFCYHWNRPCQYFPYCSSNENPLVLENLYQKEAPHSELSNTALF